MPVHSVDFIAQLEQGDYRIWVNFRGAVFERVNLGRVGQLGNDQVGAVGGHEVAVHPHHVEHDAKVWVCHLNERGRERIPVVQTATGGDGQQIKAVVHCYQLRSGAAYVAQGGNGAVAGHAD